MTLSRISMNSIYFKQFLLVTRNHGGRAMSGMRPAAVMPRDSKTENKKLQQHQRGRTEYDLSKFMTPTGMAHNLKLTKPEVVLEQVAPTSLLRKMLDTVRTSELRVSHVVERVTPVLVAVQNRLLTPMYRTLRVKLTQLHERPLAQELAQRFGPGVVTRLQHLQAHLQYRDGARKLGKEQQDGVSKLSKEQQLDGASKLGQEQHRDGARKLGQEQQDGVSKLGQEQHRDGARKLEQEQQRDGARKVTTDYKSRDSHQDLLTVRSRAPLLSRMISTLSQMIEEKAKPVNSGATQHQSIQK